MRLLPLLLLCCADPGPSLEAQSITALWHRVREQDQRIALAEKATADLERQVDDARSLCLIGGPRRRYDAGVRCSDGPFMPGSFGASAQRALHASGWCEEQVLPKPGPVLVVSR